MSYQLLLQAYCCRRLTHLLTLLQPTKDLPRPRTRADDPNAAWLVQVDRLGAKDVEF